MKHLVVEYDRIVETLNQPPFQVAVFNAAQEFPEAAAASNSMAVAAAELTILSRASFLVPVARPFLWLNCWAL
jgi:hypothetical protein